MNTLASLVQQIILIMLVIPWPSIITIMNQILFYSSNFLPVNT